jgi:hypothetical protein
VQARQDYKAARLALFDVPKHTLPTIPAPQIPESGRPYPSR